MVFITHFLLNQILPQSYCSKLLIPSVEEKILLQQIIIYIDLMSNDVQCNERMDVEQRGK
jgi:hypothetical protein